MIGVSSFEGLTYNIVAIPTILGNTFLGSEAVSRIPGAKLLIGHALEGGVYRTFFRYLQGDDSFRRKVDATACLMPQTVFFEKLMRPGVQDFIDDAKANDYRPDIWMHKPSKIKLDIGYTPEEIAITLAYAKDGDATNFLVFTRHNEKREKGRIPRRTVKRLVGTKDLSKAARQAEDNLDGIVERGAIGPFGLKSSDKVFVDRASYERSRDTETWVNFSTGLDYLSFNMRLDHVVEVLQNMYPGQVEIDDLWKQTLTDG